MLSKSEDQVHEAEKVKPGRFSLAKFIGIIWSVHVLAAALLYPSLFLPIGDTKDPKDIQKQKLYESLTLFSGTVILLFNGLSLGIFFYLLISSFQNMLHHRPDLVSLNLLCATKVLFVYITWFLIGAIYLIFNHLRSIHALLCVLEEEAIQSRDESVMLIRAGQAALKAGNRKLYGVDQVEQFSLWGLLKKIGPLALLLLRKGNVLKMAMEILKVIVPGSRIFKYLF